MQHTSIWRWTVIAVVTLGAIWFLIPSFYSFFVVPREQRNDLKAVQAKLPPLSPPAKDRISLGLDLQGGIHMVMRVDTRTALQKRTERRGAIIAKYLEDKNLGKVKVDSDLEKLQLSLVAEDPSTMDAIEKEVVSTFDEFSKVSRDGNQLVLVLDESEASRFNQDAVDQAMLVIRKRIDKWGVAEVDVRKLGTDAIQISLPGKQDPEQAKELIGTTAQLEFRLVDDSEFFRETYTKEPPDAATGITLATDEGFPQLEAKERETLFAYLKGKLPDNRDVLLECKTSRTSKKDTCDSYRTYLVEKNVPLTGESLQSADARYSDIGDPEVNLTFDAQGGRTFAELTEKNVGRRMAIVLDDAVASAPSIKEKIPNGEARITLGNTGSKTTDERLQEALTLALVLKAGALPAPVTTGEIRQVGASLGDELIKKGAYSAGLGLLLVLLFMGFYYRMTGLVANVALVLNGVFILAGLALFNATLTLPGIAGFVLTLGMAVDANVLINERIREELKNGKTARAAVDAGYDRAFWTIFDSNVTTLFAAFILFFTGTGPLRGFATTLIIGILASMFSAIVITRAINTALVHGRNAQTVSI